MTAFRHVSHALSAVLIAVVLGLVVAKFFDGPIGPIPGGAFRSGEVVTESVDDWSFAADVQLAELQLVGENQSRTVGFVLDGGEAFVPSTPSTFWPRKAAASGAAWLRIDGRRYPVNLSRITGADRTAAIRAVADAKYGWQDAGTEYFFFRVEPGLETDTGAG